MFLELWHLGSVPTAMDSPFHARCPLVQTLSLPPICSAPPPTQLHAIMPFPWALSLSQRAELSAAPPLPVRSCRCFTIFIVIFGHCLILCPYIVAPKPIPSSQGVATLHRAEWDNPFPHPAGSAGPGAPQAMVEVLGLMPLWVCLRWR